MTKHRALLIVIALALALVTAAPATSWTRPPTDDASRGIDRAEEPPPSSADEGSDADGAQFADQTFADDLIVTGSACVGFDCIDNEAFGFDTIRIKENNLRIRFFDTSNSGAFPSNDWELTANDSNNGGLNHFSITDITGGRIPFRIEAGARSNALYVESDGDIGIGTNNPAVDVHVVSGNTATTRLEQDGSAGFAAQTWDVAGNESNFFVRDATNGNLLPFRIRPSAPTSAIDIASDGDVGIGTASPDARLDVEAPDSAVVGLTTTNGDDWQLATVNSGQPGEGFSVSRTGSGQTEFRLTPDGAIVMPPTAGAATPDAGTLMFDGDTFCGFDGTAWRPLHAGGDQTCTVGP